jgi:hypothetical protein
MDSAAAHNAAHGGCGGRMVVASHGRLLYEIGHALIWGMLEPPGIGVDGC